MSRNTAAGLRGAWTALLLTSCWPLLPLAAGCSDGAGDGPVAPQILPQQSPYNLGTVPVMGATSEDEQELGQARSFTLQLSNSGGEPLVIEQARILADTRCSFSQPAILRPKAFARGRSALLLLGYRPTLPGDDEVMLEVTSNASDYPVLHVPICGTAYDPAVTPEAPAPRACREPEALELNTACPLTPEPNPAG